MSADVDLGSYVNFYDEKQGRNIHLKHLGPVEVPFKQVTAVIAIPFTKDGKLTAVRLRHRGVDLAGGHVEPYETSPEQTLNREVMEEACMTVHGPMLADVIESDYLPDKPLYMLLYGVWVDELHEFVPNEEAAERVELSVDEFIDAYNFKGGSKLHMRQAVERAWELLQAARS